MRPHLPLSSVFPPASVFFSKATIAFPLHVCPELIRGTSLVQGDFTTHPDRVLLDGEVNTHISVFHQIISAPCYRSGPPRPTCRHQVASFTFGPTIIANDQRETSVNCVPPHIRRSGRVVSFWTDLPAHQSSFFHIFMHHNAVHLLRLKRTSRAADLVFFLWPCSTFWCWCAFFQRREGTVPTGIAW